MNNARQKTSVVTTPAPTPMPAAAPAERLLLREAGDVVGNSDAVTVCPTV